MLVSPSRLIRERRASARQPRTMDRIDLMARDGRNRGLHRQCRSFVADCRIALIVGIIAVLAAPASAAAGRQAAVLEVDGAIGPGIADYVVRALGEVRPSDTGVVEIGRASCRERVEISVVAG